MCDRQCWKEGFKNDDIASVMVEGDGEPYTINLCQKCYKLKQCERKEPALHNKQWNVSVAEKRSQGKLSSGLGVRGFGNKMEKCSAAKKVFAKGLLEDSATTRTLGNSWTAESPHKGERTLLRESDSLHLPRAGRADDWSELSKSDEPWTMAKLQERYFEEGRQSAQEYCAAAEHGLHEADHRAGCGAGGGHTVARAPSLPSFPD